MLTASWENPGQSLDVNHDLAVSPIDALVGINRLNEIGGSSLGLRDPDSDAPYYDANGDGSHSPIDVLVVVNALNDNYVLLAARLDNDTAPNGMANKDRLTKDPKALVTVALGGVASLRAGFDQTDPADFVDVPLTPGKQFELEESTLELINGGPLVDREYTLRLQARGGGGPAKILDFSFTLDRTSPSATLLLNDIVRTPLDTVDVEFAEQVVQSVFDSASFELTVDGGSQSGQTVPIVSVEAIGNTVIRLRLADRLPDQNYRFELKTSISDFAGNETLPPPKQFTVADPTGITLISPANGEQMVNVARETIVRFDERVDAATITNDAFYLIANGDRVPGRVTVSSTERFATFFYDFALPASTEVRVVVDGDRIRGRDGIPIDANGVNEPGGKATADFRTLPLTRIPGTNVFGFVRDSYTGDPLVGVTVHVDAFPQANAVTTADDPATPDVNEAGRFELVDMPAPEFFVHVDGSTATHRVVDGELVPIDTKTTTYPNVGKPFHSVPGQTVQLEMNGEPFDVFLPPMALSDAQALSGTTDTQVGFGAGGKLELQEMFPEIDPSLWDQMQVTVAPGAAVDDRGNAAIQAAIIPVPPDRIPAPLPPNLDPKLVVSIQAGGATNFDVPAEVRFPNLEGLAPGEKSLIFSFNHDAGRFDVVGTGTVSADGKSIQSDPGVGIVAPGWHFVQPGTQLTGQARKPNTKFEDALKSFNEATFDLALSR